MKTRKAHVLLLRRWSDANRMRLSAMGFEVFPSDNLNDASTEDGAYVELAHPRRIARVTVWPDLQATLEVLDAASGEQLSWAYLEKADLRRIEAWSCDLTARALLPSRGRALAALLAGYGRRSEPTPAHLGAMLRDMSRALAGPQDLRAAA